MTTAPPHTAWLVQAATPLKTKNGRSVQVVEFNHTQDEAVLSAWAKHFREHYKLDSQLDVLRAGTGLSRTEYLKQFVFPSEQSRLGPAVRAGDFAEILVSDYFEFTAGYVVPRSRYRYKGTPDESTKGADLMGFKMNPPPKGKTHSANDVLLCVEVKAQFSGKYDNEKLQEAITHSSKDMLRRGVSLSAAKQRALIEDNIAQSEMVERFQNVNDRPYKNVMAAAAVYCSTVFVEDTVKTATTEDHPDPKEVQLLVFRGTDMMKLVHSLYERAANEA